MYESYIPREENYFGKLDWGKYAREILCLGRTRTDYQRAFSGHEGDFRPFRREQ